MQRIILVLVVASAVRGMLSCEPCNCSVGFGSNKQWSGLQVAACRNVKDLASIPTTDMLPDHTQVLYIDGGSIPTIKENQFVSFKNLQTIDIYNSQVSKIERYAFRNMTKVKDINLYRNLITELPDGLFLDTPGLIELRLQGNNLKVLHKNLFSNLLNLRLVDLSRSHITAIERNCFVNVPQLKVLFLHGNELTTLSLNIIDNYSSNLKELYLEQNPWHCDEAMCGVMVALVTRRLWGPWNVPNCVTPQSLQGKQWNSLKEHDLLRHCPTCSPCRCDELTVAHCDTPLSNARVPATLPTNITRLHFTDQQLTTLHNNAFSSYGLLQELHLEGNHICSIEPNVFLNLSSLEVLNVADNNVKELQTNTFIPTTNLRKILLNRNNLTRLNKFLFSNLARLEEVDLSSNIINFIEQECFVNVPSLRTISLNNNQLKSLELHIMDNARSLKRLYLEGNPWRCDEALCGVLDAVVGGALWGARTAPACASPSPLTDKAWPQLLQHFHPTIFILDSNQHWTEASRATNVHAERDVTLQCRYCFVSRVTWTLNGVKLPGSYQQTSQDAHISTLIMENIHKEEQGAYVCQVSQCPECDTAWLHVSVNTTTPETQELKQVFNFPSTTCSCQCKAIENAVELSQIQTPEPSTETQTIPSWLPVR